MKKRITIIYETGFKDEFVMDLSETQFEDLADVVNKSFWHGKHAVLRLHNENEANFIDVSRAIRVSFETVEEE